MLTDVDGVLTDATVCIGAGIELKRFNIQDGLGIGALRKMGIRVGWISSRPSESTSIRAAELKIDFIHQAKASKLEAAEAIVQQAGIGWTEVCYAGDDLVDLVLLRRAGVAVAVANAVAEAKTAADYVTRAAGGHGAVREIAELILKAQKKWTEVVRTYAQ